MLSRALSLATVTLLIGCFAAAPAWAQVTNLEAGKSPSQIFAGACTACHKGPRGLLKTVAPGSLAGFLRQHYTTSPEMASSLSGYLVSNGAADTRYGAGNAKQGKDERQEARPAGGVEQLDRHGRKLHPGAPSQEAAKPDADGLSQQAEPGRAAKRLARPAEPSETAKPAAEGHAPAQAAVERGPDGRKLTARQRLRLQRARPGAEQPPKAATVREEPARGEPENGDRSRSEPNSEPGNESAKVDSGKPDSAKSESAKPESGKLESTTPPGEGKSEAVKIEAPKDNSAAKPVSRADPVAPVTSAPPAAPAASNAVSGAPPESARAARPSASAPSAEPAVTASAPQPPAPAATGGPPAPPISQ